METAYWVFRRHPNFKEIRFVVEPLLREKIIVAADMPSFDSFKVITEEYLPLWEELGGKLEYSKEELSPNPETEWQPWYWNSLNETFQKRIESNLKFSP